MNNGYAGYGNLMFNTKRPYRRHEDSVSDYDISDHPYTESEEFMEEYITEEEEE